MIERRISRLLDLFFCFGFIDHISLVSIISFFFFCLLIYHIILFYFYFFIVFFYFFILSVFFVVISYKISLNKVLLGFLFFY